MSEPLWPPVVQVSMRAVVTDDARPPGALYCADCRALLMPLVNAPPYDELICNVCDRNERPQWHTLGSSS